MAGGLAYLYCRSAQQAAPLFLYPLRGGSIPNLALSPEGRPLL